jgi:hypothetical protein
MLVKPITMGRSLFGMILPGYFAGASASTCNFSRAEARETQRWDGMKFVAELSPMRIYPPCVSWQPHTGSTVLLISGTATFGRVIRAPPCFIFNYYAAAGDNAERLVSLTRLEADRIRKTGNKAELRAVVRDLNTASSGCSSVLLID